MNLDHHKVESRYKKSLNFAPFHTTDCSMADVKRIYVVGTFPDTSWGLGKISVICLRETVVARLEMRVFVSTTVISICHKPPVLPEEDTQSPALPQTSFVAFHPLPLLAAVPREKQSLLLPIGYGLLAAMQ